MREKLDIDKKELEDYYRSHSINLTAKYFSTSNYKIKKLLIEYDILIHSMSESVLLYARNNESAFHSKIELEFLQIKNSIDIEELKRYYSNHDNFETKKLFNINCNFKRLMEELDIPLHTSYETFLINSINQYGSYEEGKRIRAIKFNNSFNLNKQEHLSKRFLTNLKRYGSISPLGNKEVLNRAKQTFMDKYGVDNPFRIKDLVKNATLNKYGVPSTACLPEVRAKLIKNGKHHLAKDGKRFDSSWEAIVYNYCLDNNLSVLTLIPIKYIYNDEEHITFIDFKIDNRLYEVKGNHLLEGVFDDKNPIPSSVKIDLYRKYDVSIITDIKLIKDWDRYKNLTLIDICNFSGSIL